MDVKEVTDPQALKALAHPLRLRLLGSLRMDGPQTASELGRRFDESSGSTSYHLRVLAKHDFIAEDTNQPNARDKRWRAQHAYTKWNDADFDDPVGAAAAQTMRDHQLDNVVNASRRFEGERDAWGEDWSGAAGHSDYAIRLSPQRLRRLRSRFLELIEEEREHGDDDSPLVRVYLSAFPVNDTEYLTPAERPPSGSGMGPS